MATAYNGYRPSEAAGAYWSEIDYENSLWNIPAERMESKKPHAVPLSDQALALLDVMKPISSHSEYVFPSNSSLKKHANTSTANMALKRMGFENQLVAHGLRSIASTTLNDKALMLMLSKPL